MSVDQTPLSLAGRIGRFCERLNGLKLHLAPAAVARGAEFVVRDDRGRLYCIRVTPYA